MADKPIQTTPQPVATAQADAVAATPKRRRLRMSYVWAFLFLAAISGWMLSGNAVIGAREEDSKKAPAANAAPPPAPAFRVRVRTISAAPREGVITLRGRTEADARVQVRAETSGVVESVPVTKGSVVKAGDVLCMVEKAARQAGLAEAEAALAQADADAQASGSLAEKGYGSKLKVNADRAKLDAARAMVEKAQLELARTEIRAPFDGLIEDAIKPGDYLNAGGMMMGGTALVGACAMLVKSDPLLVIGHVSERQVGKLKIGMKAMVRLVSGETVQAVIRFIGSSADEATRTFRVELEAPNPDRLLRDGVTAEIAIPVPSESAHLITPAILALDDNGAIGVRVVDDDERARFLPVRILADGPDGVFVAGLPQSVRVITVGQDYVAEGARVEAVEEDAGATAEARP